MGLYRELIRYACERDPGLLKALPEAEVVLEAEEMLGQGDLFVLGRLQRHLDVLGRIGPGEIEAALYRALDEARIDDVCLLLHHLEGVRPVDRARIAGSYDDLAVRGNVVGIEDLAKASGVPARIGEAAALRAYEVLAAMGRVHAIDYVRQLSGVPVRFGDVAVHQGYRQLARAGRLESLRALYELSAVRPEITLDDLLPTALDAAGNLRLRALADLSAAAGFSPSLIGFDQMMDDAVAAGRYEDVPDLLALCADADPDRVDEETAAGMARSADLRALLFVYRQKHFRPVHDRFADAAHVIAAEAGSSRLQLAVFERTERPPSPEAARAVLGSALLSGDADWVRELGPLAGPFPPDLTQLFLLGLNADLPVFEAVTGVRFDRDLAHWLDAVRRADMDEVRRRAPDRHPVGRAVRDHDRPAPG